MAHSCPECDSQCYCNGDIDDCLLSDADTERDCTCCVGKDRDGYADDDYEDIDLYGGEE
jgi:hypothetical protein